MGSWGPGNFQNDTAGEYLFEVVQPLLNQIETAIQDPVSMEPDEFDGVVMICNIEILASLAEGLDNETQAGLIDLPAPATIEAWREAYLKVWDRCIDSLNPTPSHKTQRRVIITNTFQRLIDAASR